MNVSSRVGTRPLRRVAALELFWLYRGPGSLPSTMMPTRSQSSSASPMSWVQSRIEESCASRDPAG